VTHLRRIMLEELQRRSYANSTARYHLRAVEQFARHFGKSPDNLGRPRPTAGQNARPDFDTRPVRTAGKTAASRCSHPLDPDRLFLRLPKLLRSWRRLRQGGRGRDEED